MKLEIDINDEAIDAIVVTSLRRTLECVNSDQAGDLFPDREIIAKACRQMIAYHTTNEPLSE